MVKERNKMKKIFVLLAILFPFFLSVSANAQCKIVPQGLFAFPNDLNRDFIQIQGTWMSVEKPYDLRNSNTSVVTCDRQNHEWAVTTAYIVSDDLPLLDLWECYYKVIAWNSEIIVAMGVPWLKKQNDEGRPILTIKRSDKSVVEDNSTLAGILVQHDLPKNRRMILKEGNPLRNESLKKFYGM
jgi:hypothetical protein